MMNGIASSADVCSKKCNLKFYPKTNDLEISSSSVEEENEVARRQYEEDLRLYGSRLEPMDDIEVDVMTALPNSPTMTEFETRFDDTKKSTRFDYTEKVHKIETNSENNEASTYSDLKDGANPLSEWLTQSALPSVIPMRSHPVAQSSGTEIDLVKEESREIEVFRYVHLASDPPNGAHATDTTNIEDVTDLELPSQIYYRNIVDRYPLLPTYLARRLAEANSSRADRLSCQRVEASAKASGVDKALRHARVGARRVYGSSAGEKETQATTPLPLVRSGTQAKQEKPLNRSRVTSPDFFTRNNEPSHDRRPKNTRKRASSYTTLSKNQPQYDYWSGGRPGYRTKSVGSRSSSRNSSLHGSPKFSHQKEYQNVWNFTPNPSYCHYYSPSLPPPPVKFSKSRNSKRKPKRLSFDCDMCGEKVRVDRRRQWQYVGMHECHKTITYNFCQETRHEGSPSLCLHCSRMRSCDEILPFPQ